jgi:uncharacterized protein (TIGR00255 family)
MIFSMTGYGSASGEVDGLHIVTEVRSVNNRFLDVSIRIPRTFLFAEDALKKVVQKHISRGKTDVYVTIDSSKMENVSVVVNEPLLKAYVKAMSDIADIAGVSEEMSAMKLGELPDVLSVEKQELDQSTVTTGLCTVLECALKDFDRMRGIEGNKLGTDIARKLDLIEEYVLEVEKKSPEIVENYSRRLREKMDEVIAESGYDEKRIIEEVAIYADHIATDEEVVRLKSHISQMRQMLQAGSPIGRKMDFLIQEFNREANTIGSKCQSSEISRVVVEMKSEIEKIREQIQNIE